MGTDNSNYHEYSNAATLIQKRATAIKSRAPEPAPSKSKGHAPSKRKGRSVKGQSTQDTTPQYSTPLILPDADGRCPEHNTLSCQTTCWKMTSKHPVKTSLTPAHFRDLPTSNLTHSWPIRGLPGNHLCQLHRYFDARNQYFINITEAMVYIA